MHSIDSRSLRFSLNSKPVQKNNLNKRFTTMKNILVYSIQGRPLRHRLANDNVKSLRFVQLVADIVLNVTAKFRPSVPYLPIHLSPIQLELFVSEEGPKERCRYATRGKTSTTSQRYHATSMSPSSNLRQGIYKVCSSPKIK